MLNWWTELSEEDQVPTELYGRDEQITEWFEQVKARHRNGSVGASAEPMEEVPQVSNELVAELMGKVG